MNAKEQIWKWVLLISISILLAYSNSFQGPFIFDDIKSIPDNHTIRNLYDSLSKKVPNGETVSSRPILNFSFGLNYAWSKLEVWSYHFVNVIIHLLAALVLFSFIWRTLKSPCFSEKIQNRAIYLAGWIALGWGIHPLQTESVTYIVHRSESLMGLFYLLVLWSFQRSQKSLSLNRVVEPEAQGLCPSNFNHSKGWLLLSCLFCYLGMATKEIMASAPLIVLIYDFIFIEKCFQKLWAKRGWYYLTIFSSWVLSAYLFFQSNQRGNALGFDAGITVFDYLKTQVCALVVYLKLFFWPETLILDYGPVIIPPWSQVIPSALLIGTLAFGVLWLLKNYPHWGFWGLWIAFVLAPTSSFIPILTQMIVEHRIYLALAPFLFLLVVGGYQLGIQKIGLVMGVVSIFWGWRTYERNQDYQSTESIWRSTVSAVPLNSRAHHNYAVALFNVKKLEEAEFHLNETIRLEPYYFNAYLNYGRLYQAKGDLVNAERMYRHAIVIRSHFSEAKLALSELLINQGNFKEAEKFYLEIIQENPSNSIAYLNLGVIYERRHDWLEAEQLYLKALENEVQEPLITERLSKIQEKLLP